MFRLERPNMALNDPRLSGIVGGALTPVRFQMWQTWDIQANEERDHIIDWVASIARGAPRGRLKHLVLNCHGLPGYIQLGAGFNRTHLPLFDGWQGLVEKIWLTACRAANIPTAADQAALDRGHPGLGAGDGNIFCSELAKRTGAYVVAATELQCHLIRDFPPDMMASFEGLVLCYGPKGDVTWSSRNKSTWMRTAPDGSQQCVPMPD
jgi:hypothetical protein